MCLFMDPLFCFICPFSKVFSWDFPFVLSQMGMGPIAQELDPLVEGSYKWIVTAPLKLDRTLGWLVSSTKRYPTVSISLKMSKMGTKITSGNLGMKGSA